MKYRLTVILLGIVPSILFLPSIILMLGIGFSNETYSDYQELFPILWALGGILGIIGLLFLAIFKIPPRKGTTLLLVAGCLSAGFGLFLAIDNMSVHSFYDIETYMFLALIFPIIISIRFFKNTWVNNA